MKHLCVVTAINQISSRRFQLFVQNALGEVFKVEWNREARGDGLSGKLADGRNGGRIEIRWVGDRPAIYRNGRKEPATPESWDEAKLQACILLDHYGAIAEAKS